MGGKLDVIWFAWAVSLAEQAGDEKLLKEARRLSLCQCLEYKKRLESMDSAYRTELLEALNMKIKTLGWLATKDNQ